MPSSLVLSPPRRGMPSLPMASAVLAVMTLAGCASSAAQSAAPSTAIGTVAPTAGIASLPVSSQAPASTLPDATLAAIAADAAGVTGVDPAKVVVVSVKPVTWMDGSLGCPKPGVMYTQSVVPGFRVIVRAGERTLDYRIGRGGTPKRCDSGSSIGSDG
jgi:hypothetical protein